LDKQFIANGNKGINPRLGTIIVAGVLVLARFAAIYTMKYFGRRTLLLVGQSAITVLLVLIAFSTMYGWDTINIIFICFFVFAFQTTINPVSWTYSIETCTDVSLSIMVCCDAAWGVLLTLVFPDLEAWSFSNTMFIAAAISGVSVVFVFFFIGETKGLSDKEKKEIFMPGANWGRALRDGEHALPELGKEHKSRRTIRRES
jgi:MFS family permease